MTEQPTEPSIHEPGPEPTNDLDKNTLGLVALIMAITGVIFSLIPLLNFVGWILLFVSLILGIVAVCQTGKKKGTGIAAIVTSLIGGVIAVIAAMVMVVGALGGAIDEAQKSASASPSASETSSPASEAPVETPAPVEEATEDAAASEENVSEDEQSQDSSVPTEYLSALESAKFYHDQMHMSKAGLYDQLTSEYGDQFSAEAAQYAVDTIEADWNANALESAKFYQDEMNMSPEAIRDQLTSEYGDQFTQEQADYAVANL